MRFDELENVAGQSPAELSAARAVWSRLRVDPAQHDFTHIDRAILRASADQRLRRVESGHLRRVLWPGFALAGGLAALGLTLVVLFGVEKSDSSSAAIAAVSEDSPRIVGAGARVGGAQPDVVRVGRSTVRTEQGAAIRVVEVSEAHTLVALDAGAASFEVGKRHEGAEYVVESGRVTVTVVGTAFRVSRALEGAVQVAVEHGLVRVARDGVELALLRAGESIDVPEADPDLTSSQGDEGGEPGAGAGRVVDGATPLALGDSTELAEQSDAPALDSADGLALAADQPSAVQALPAGGDAGAAETVPSSDAVAVRRQPSTPPAESSLRRHPRVARPVLRPTSLGPTVEARPQPAPAPPKAQPAPKPAAVAPVAVVEPVVVVKPFVAPAEPAGDDATESLRGIVSGLSPAACAPRLSELRAWLQKHPRHRRTKVARHALAYCLYHTDHRAEADRLFGQLGLRIKDMLDPQPPRF